MCADPVGAQDTLREALERISASSPCIPSMSYKCVGTAPGRYVCARHLAEEALRAVPPVPAEEKRVFCPDPDYPGVCAGCGLREGQHDWTTWPDGVCPGVPSEDGPA